MGGDNVVFWGPLAWTVIYGLFVATFLTLIVVPILFFLSIKLKMWGRRKFTSQPLRALEVETIEQIEA